MSKAKVFIPVIGGGQIELHEGHPAIDDREFLRAFAATGYNYGADALEHVHTGWELAKRRPNLDAIQQAIEERDDAEQRYHLLATEMVYRGNTVSYIYDKNEHRGRVISDACEVVSSAGIEVGAIGLVEGVKLLAQRSVRPARTAPNHEALSDILNALERQARSLDAFVKKLEASPQPYDAMFPYEDAKALRDAIKAGPVAWMSVDPNDKPFMPNESKAAWLSAVKKSLVEQHYTKPLYAIPNNTAVGEGR